MSVRVQASESESDVRWVSPASGVWVASRRGDHVGTVERLIGSYHATNARGRELGSFDDLDSARDVIDGTGSRPRPATTHHPVTAVLWGIIVGGGAVAVLLLIALFRVAW